MYGELDVYGSPTRADDVDVAPWCGRQRVRSVLGTGEVEVNARIPPALSPSSICHMSAYTVMISNEYDSCLEIRDISGEVR